MASDDVVGSDEAVAAQARMFETPGTPWYAVSKGTLADIQAIWPETPCCRPHHSDVSLDSPCGVCGCTADVFARGPVGENVLHLCVLFHTPETVKMAKYLIKRFGPSLVNAPYQTRKKMNEHPGLYEGEVVLHIAIVHKDVDLVRFMLDHGARLDAHTVGAFFSPGRVYFGETPFSFAASMGDKDIVRILLDHAEEQGGEKQRREVMTAADAFGNTALHMCVANNQLEMYNFLVDEMGFPETSRNNAGMTPFIQAAHDGNERAFDVILKRRFSVVWTYGPVTNYSLSLEGIDTVGSDPMKHDPSVLDVVLKRRHLGLLSHPILVAMLEMKWTRFGRSAYFRYFAFYAAFLAIFSWQMHWHATRRDPSEWRSTERTAMEWTTLALVMIMLAQHARDLAHFVRAYYRQVENLSLNSKTSEVPLYCLPGQRAERLTNEMQMPRALKIVRPRRGTKFGRKGSIGHGEFEIKTAPSLSSRWTSQSRSTSLRPQDSRDSLGMVSGVGLNVNHLFNSTNGSADASKKRKSWKSIRKVKSAMSVAARLGAGSKSRKAGYVERSDTFRRVNVFRTEEEMRDDVYVMEVSVVARRRWRMIREHWISQRSCVRIHQIIRQRNLIHSDDYDDRVTVLLHVHVLEARGLRVADGFDVADPYCVVTAAPGVRSVTQCLRGTRDPRWSRAFSFTAPPGIRRSANALTFSVASHDEDDEDDELGTACVPYHDVPYVAPGMIPPGPVWLDLTTHDEAEATSDGAVSITAPIDVGARGDEVTTATVVAPERLAVGAGDGDGTKDASKMRGDPPYRGGGVGASGLGQLLVEVYYEVRGLSEEDDDDKSTKAKKSVDGGVTADASTTSVAADASTTSVAASVEDEREPGPPPTTNTVSSSSSVSASSRRGGGKKSRHTAFERGIGTANQEKAMRRRLASLGYAVDDGGGANVGLGSRSRSGAVARSGANDKPSRKDGEEDDDDNEDDHGGSRRARFAEWFERARRARGAVSYYVDSVLVPQPSLAMNLVHIVLQTAHFIIWSTADGPSAADDILLSVASLTAWGFTLYFASGFRALGHLTVIVVRCVADIVRFSSLWLVAMVAFTQAFYVLDAAWAAEDGNEPTRSMGEVVWLLFAVATNADPFSEVFPEEDTPVTRVKTMYTALGVVFNVLMSMLMLNVIIAMFNQTYQSVSAKAHEQWRLQWALKILLAEAQLPAKTRFAMRLGEDAEGKGGEKMRVHNFEVHGGGRSHDRGSLEAAVSDLLGV